VDYAAQKLFMDASELGGLSKRQRPVGQASRISTARSEILGASVEGACFSVPSGGY